MGRFCCLSSCWGSSRCSLAAWPCTGCRHITSALGAGQAGDTAKGQRQPSGVRQTCRTGHFPYILVFPCFSCFPSFPSYFLPVLGSSWRSLSAESHCVVYSVNYKPKHFCPPKTSKWAALFSTEAALFRLTVQPAQHNPFWWVPPCCMELSLSALREWAH